MTMHGKSLIFVVYLKHVNSATILPGRNYRVDISETILLRKAGCK